MANAFTVSCPFCATMVALQSHCSSCMRELAVDDARLSRATDTELDRIAAGEDPWIVLGLATPAQPQQAATATLAQREAAAKHLFAGVVCLGGAAAITVVSLALAGDDGGLVYAAPALALAGVANLVRFATG